MSGKDDLKGSSGGNIISDLVISAEQKPVDGGLIGETDSSVGQGDSFSLELERTLQQTEKEVLTFASNVEEAETLSRARALVEKFQPVPWFIWRLSNFVFGKSGKINKISEGLVLGLRRLLFAAASDSVLGVGRKVNNVREALSVLPPDVIAAVSVMYAVNRRLSSRPHERIWKPILDDALLRAQIGYILAQNVTSFGPGRAMLAGFAGRVGLAIQIASGELDQARRSLELLATGAELGEVGLKLYGCEPLQVSAMTLSAGGCGRDAAFGTIGWSVKARRSRAQTDDQRRWLASFAIIEGVRLGKGDAVEPEMWDALGIQSGPQRTEFLDAAKQIVRRGHGWGWIT